MIDWEAITEAQGFKEEKEMWNVLMTALRNNDAIAKHLGVSRGAIQRRRYYLQLNKPSRRGRTYRKADKRIILSQLNSEMWMNSIDDIQTYIYETHGVSISRAYISKYRRRMEE
jgi:Zn-dependent peptidase ImmA (M78 family)